MRDYPTVLLKQTSFRKKEEEVKTIKNFKSTRIRPFTFVLMLILLLSSMIGTSVWAGKPEKPGKPDNPGKPVETWDLQVQIGMKNQVGEPMEDIVLMAPVYLLAEDVSCSGGLWDFPDEPKGKSGKDGKLEYINADFTLYRWYDETEDKWVGPDCGFYHLGSVFGTNNDGGGVYLDGIIPEDPEYHVVQVTIGHYVHSDLEQDYWRLMLIWAPKQPDNTLERYILCAWTNEDFVPEVEPPEGNEIVVQFEEVVGVLSTGLFAPYEVPENYNWLGLVSFTLKIQRI